MFCSFFGHDLRGVRRIGRQHILFRRVSEGIGDDVQSVSENMNNKLYVGGLPYSTTEDALEQLFSEHGTVESAKAIQIVDLYHARQRLFELGKAVLGGDSPEIQPWVRLNDHGPRLQVGHAASVLWRWSLRAKRKRPSRP